MKELSAWLRGLEVALTRKEMRAITLLLCVGALIMAGCATQSPSPDQVPALHVQHVPATATAWAQDPAAKEATLAKLPKRYLDAVVQTQAIATSTTGSRRANCGGIVLAQGTYQVPQVDGSNAPVNVYGLLDLQHCLNIENPQNSADVMPAKNIMVRTADEYNAGKPGHLTTIAKVDPLVDLTGRPTEIEFVTVVGQPGDTIPGMVPFGFDHFANGLTAGETNLGMESFPSEAIPGNFVDANMTYTGTDPDTSLAIINTDGARGTSASVFIDNQGDLAGFMTRESATNPDQLLAVLIMNSAAAQASFDWDLSIRAIEQRTVGLQP